MGHEITIPVGVVVACEEIDNQWLEDRWRPLAVVLNPPQFADWTEIARGDGFVHYHAATQQLEFHRKETASYVANIESGEPSIYVVLRYDPEATPPRSVLLATASPYEAQAYGESGQEVIEPVPMPAPLVEMLKRFVAEHHVEEKFVKRQRQQHHAEEAHLFGKEPIFGTGTRGPKGALNGLKPGSSK